MLDCQIYGLNPWGHHLTSVLLHTANALLLFWFLVRATGALEKSFFVAALFALHPLHVESVAWVSERKDVLSGLFWMSTLMAYAGYTNRPTPYRYAATLLLFAVGLMAKPMLVTLPFVFLLLDFWPFRRRKTWAALVVEKAPFFILTAVSSAVTFLAQVRGGAVISLERTSLGLRLENAIVSYWAYVAKMLFPARLSVFYPYPGHDLPLGQVGGAALFLLCVSILALRRARSAPHVFVGWFWYVGTLAPVIGIVQVGNQAMADRYTYIPLIGVFWGITWEVGSALTRRWDRRVVAGSLGTAAVVICALITARQVGYWKDTRTLFQHAIQSTPNNKMAYGKVGCTLLQEKRFDEAEQYFNAALSIDANYVPALTNLAVIRNAAGRKDEAMALYRQALSVNPNYVNALINYGIMLCEQGQGDAGLDCLLQASSLQPTNSEAHYNAGMALFYQGKYDEAFRHFSEALDCKPDDAQAAYALGVILSLQQRQAEAAEMFSLAVRLDPNHPDARRELENLQGSATNVAPSSRRDRP
jgi:tetratricopeptide (TPR) repeat protein